MSQEFSLSSRVQASESMLTSDLGDEIVMMCMEQGRYFSLKGPSFRIWELLKEPTTLEGVQNTLLEEYDVPAEKCEQELLALVAEMHDRQMIVACD